MPFHRVDVVLNGKVVASREATAGTREMTWREKVQVPGPGWLAARCVSRQEPIPWGLLVAAHTSPVYVRVPGQELFSPASAAYFLKLIDGSQAWTENVATRADAPRREAIRKMFNDARDEWHKKMHSAGVAH